MVLRSIEYWSHKMEADECKFSNGQISDLTGVGISHIGTHLNALAQRKIVCLGKGHCRTIKLNPNVDQWQLKKGSKEARPIVKRTVDKPMVSPKMEPNKAKGASKKSRNVTPEWFKELWRLHPEHRRGGNYHAGWKKWQSMGSELTDEDPVEAKKWYLEAAKSDPTNWAQDAKSGFALGFVKFIGQTHWRIKVPIGLKQNLSFDDYNQEPIDYSANIPEGWVDGSKITC